MRFFSATNLVWASILQLVVSSDHSGYSSPSGPSGCGKSLPHDVRRGVTTNVTIPSGGIERNYLIHLPEKYNPHRPHSLILSYHGRTQDSQIQEALSQFSNSSYNKHAIAVYPNGSPLPSGNGYQWQGDPAADPSINDVLFTSDLIESLSQTYCIDPSRIYAAGKSNGAGFVNILACDPAMSSKIAAFAPVSAAIYLDAKNNTPPCNPSRTPVPLMEFHGYLDDTIAYNGFFRRGFFTYPIPQYIHDWAVRDGCSKKRKSTLCTGKGQSEVIEYEWKCRGVKDALVHYNISNIGHDWPSTYPNEDGDLTTCFDATTKIMEFFERHPLP